MRGFIIETRNRIAEIYDSLITGGRAALLDHLDGDISDLAPASTAVSSADLSTTRIGKLDNLDAAISSITPLAQSVQYKTVSLLVSDTERTATITSVNTNKTIIVPLGVTRGGGSATDAEGAWSLIDATTIKWIRGRTGSYAATAYCVVVTLK